MAAGVGFSAGQRTIVGQNRFVTVFSFSTQESPMTKPAVSMQPSEIALYAAASRIYASYVASGHVNAGNESSMIERSVDEALQMAQLVEEKAQSDHAQ